MHLYFLLYGAFMIKCEINKNDAGQRLDKFVEKTVKGMPKSLMYKYIRKKRIKVNGKRCEISTVLAVGDLVEMYIPAEFSDEKKSAEDFSEYSRVQARPDVVYEDDNILVVSKKPGMLAHTGDEDENHSKENSERDTLVFIIKAYLYNKGEWQPEKENSFAPALCNRIDRNTGGLVIAAKNAAALREVNEAIREHKIEKNYLCAVHGRPEKKEDRLTAYLFKNSKTKTVTVYDKERVGAKPIITNYKTLAYNKALDISLLSIGLETGRTHQIRAHMAHIGHPLLGEGKYARNEADRKLGYKYQALYSYKLTFGELSGELSYLSGKSFRADADKIFFLTEFGKESVKID